MYRRQLKLLLVIHHLSPTGGAEVQLAYLAKGLAELGHRVTICCVDDWSIDQKPFEAVGIGLVSLRARTRLRRIASIPRLVRLARQADAVQCTMWDASLWGRIAAIVARRPVIVADHATDRSVQVAAGGAPRASWIERHNRLLDPFTFATVACASSQAPVLIREGVAPRKIVHIPNGIPIDELRSAAGRGPTGGEVKLPPGAPVVMQVAVFRDEKNQQGALEAVALARQQLGDIQLVYVGAGVSEAGVKQRARKIGASAWTHFLGEREDVPALLARADVMLLPSIADAMPMTLLEAMSLGVPVVATEVGDVPEVLGDAGICVPPGNYAELARGLVRVLSDPTLRSELGETGRVRARSFDASVMTQRYAALFEAAVSGQAAAPELTASL